MFSEISTLLTTISSFYKVEQQNPLPDYSYHFNDVDYLTARTENLISTRKTSLDQIALAKVAYYKKETDANGDVVPLQDQDVFWSQIDKLISFDVEIDKYFMYLRSSVLDYASSKFQYLQTLISKAGKSSTQTQTAALKDPLVKEIRAKESMVV